RVRVGDLLAEGALPAGIAGLRVEAGLTMAAGAAALAAHLPSERGIAANRASLSKAETGGMPLSWQGSAAQVRTAMSTAYQAEPAGVCAAWYATFATTPAPIPVSEEARYLNGTTPGVAETAPPTETPEEPDAEEEPSTVTVLVGGDPDTQRELWIHLDGHRIGHLENLHTWNHQPGWAFYTRLTEQEQHTLTRTEQGGRAPDATTSLCEIDAAVRQLLNEALPEVAISAVHGRHDGPGRPRPGQMERWELYRGRIPGREDVLVRGRCWGCLQPTEDGFTAHTPDGPVPGRAHPTRGQAVAALWAHLNAPLPPPPLGEHLHARRGLRAPFDARPQCPYTQADLARATLSKVADERGIYEVRVGGEQVGLIYRNDYAARNRQWQATSLDERARREAPTRAAALQELLAQPGPLWAD